MATAEQLNLFRKQTKELLTAAETADVKEALNEFLEDKVRMRALLSIVTPELLLCCHLWPSVSVASSRGAATFSSPHMLLHRPTPSCVVGVCVSFFFVVAKVWAPCLHWLRALTCAWVHHE